MKQPYPFTRDTTYELTAEGLVRVVRGPKEGLFTWEGVWVSGELRTADPQMCIWVGGWNGWRSGADAVERTQLIPRPKQA